MKSQKSCELQLNNDEFQGLRRIVNKERREKKRYGLRLLLREDHITQRRTLTSSTGLRELSKRKITKKKKKFTNFIPLII